MLLLDDAAAVRGGGGGDLHDKPINSALVLLARCHRVTSVHNLSPCARLELNLTSRAGGTSVGPQGTARVHGRVFHSLPSGSRGPGHFSSGRASYFPALPRHCPPAISSNHAAYSGPCQASVQHRHGEAHASPRSAPAGFSKGFRCSAQDDSRGTPP